MYWLFLFTLVAYGFVSVELSKRHWRKDQPAWAILAVALTLLAAGLFAIANPS